MWYVKLFEWIIWNLFIGKIYKKLMNIPEQFEYFGCRVTVFFASIPF